MSISENDEFELEPIQQRPIFHYIIRGGKKTAALNYTSRSLGEDVLKPLSTDKEKVKAHRTKAELLSKKIVASLATDVVALFADPRTFDPPEPPAAVSTNLQQNDSVPNLVTPTESVHMSPMKTAARGFFGPVDSIRSVGLVDTVCNQYMLSGRSQGRATPNVLRR